MLQYVTHSKNVRRRATYDDLLKVPDHKVAEIVDGVLYVSPRPSFRHSRATSKLNALLAPLDVSDGELGGWWILVEPELHFDSDVVVPDLAGWRVERMPEIPDVKFGTLAPDWVCEVLSPTTARLDREKKLKVYARAGVRHVWLLDPIARTLEVFASDGRRMMFRAMYGADEPLRAAPFEALEIDPKAFWGKVDVPVKH